MLFRIERVDTNLGYINSVLKYFLCKALRAERYSRKGFFPRDFLPVVECNRNNVENNFRALFHEIKILDQSQKVLILRTFRNNAQVELLCMDKNIRLLQVSAFPENCKTALRNLGDYLYSNVLKNSKYIGLERVSETKEDHYSRFKEVNGEVCCFCGMRPYTDQLSNQSGADQWLPAYDHYFPKFKYPLTTVNFRNLIPICDICNSKAKNQIDPCHCSNQGRRLSYYPYAANDDIKLEYRLKSDWKTSMSDKWEVVLKLSGISDEEKEKRETWDSMFKVTSRLEARLNNIFRDWLQQALNGASSSGTNLRNQLKKQAELYAGQAKRTSDSLHKSRFFDYVSKLDSEDLELLVKTCVLEAQNPQTYEQGMELLAESGINL